jgi:ABC-type uncharacterized transport system involved in gliding motility auxiliary subunit
VHRFARLTVPTGLLTLLAGAIASNVRPDLKAWMGPVMLIGAVLILLGLYQSFDRITVWLHRRSTKAGLNIVLMAVLVLGIIGLVEAISAKHNLRIDLTEGRRYTLSDQTKKIVKGLTDDVQVTAFYRSDQPDRRAAQDLLRQYAELSPKFRYEVVDPDRQPGRAKRYGITLYGTTVLETGDREEKITEVEEHQLTNGLLRLLRKGKPVVYFLAGHGERDVEDGAREGYRQAKEALEKANYEVRPLLLLRERQVPGDASVVAISGPKRDLVEPELKALTAYIERGGSLLVQLDPFSAPGLVTFLSKYGIVVGDDVIVDEFSRVLGGDYLMPVITAYRPHPITRDFALASLFPFARSVDAAREAPEGVSLQPLGETGAGSWAETSQDELRRGRLTFDKRQDKGGPVPVGVAATVKRTAAAQEATGSERVDTDSTERPGRDARVVVYGTSAFASNSFLNFSGNRDLFLNTISWLAEDEDQISIRPREAKSAPVFLTAVQGRLAFWVPVVVVPAIILITGTSVVVRRRRSR